MAMVRCEEKSSIKRSPVACPKPRRLGFLAMNWQRSNQQGEMRDSELLDMILMKDSYGEVLSPFFCGSPPTRVSNPLIHDANFGDEKLSPLSTLQKLASPSSPSTTSGSMSPSAMKSGCAMMNFGLKQAPIRVEGFNCLSRDRQNTGITAVA